jgi:cellulose synthase/poly-beta-1,6-N-acetylglucosamine synthase-like glycosyltransferase
MLYVYLDSFDKYNGLEIFKGDIFVVLDSDDWFYPNAVKIFNTQFRNNHDMKALIKTNHHCLEQQKCHL